MYFVRKYTAILPVTAAFSLLVASCGSNKIADCNRILEISNKHSPKAEAVGKKTENLEPKNLLIQAEQADQKAKEMGVLEIRDGKLKEYKTRFVKAYKDESKALRDAAKIANKTDSSSINTSLKATDMYLKATEVYNQQITIVNELTTYCTK